MGVEVVHEQGVIDGVADAGCGAFGRDLDADVVPVVGAQEVGGIGVLAEDGGIDRPALARLVFADAAARADLEAIVFPLVRARFREAARVPLPRGDAPARGSGTLAASTWQITIHIIPLLFESHWETDYDIILCIASPEDQQIDRMMASRDYSRAHAEARLAAQWPVSEKAARSHYTVMNDSTPEHLRDEAKRLVAWLKEQVK